MTVFARLGSADHEFAAEEFFIVQFFDCALGFVDRLHRDEGETFRALIVAIAHDLGVLNVADAVEELEQIALGCIEGQIANVQTRRSNFDRFGFVLRPRFARLLLLLLLLTVTRLRSGFSLAAAVSAKSLACFNKGASISPYIKWGESFSLHVKIHLTLGAR